MKKILDGVLLDMTEDEIQEMQRIDAVNLEQDIALLPKKHRAKRDVLLSETDWTQVADAPVDATVWATYRQALRDITSHANWPNLSESDWPVKPE